jgi:hypothetical protein
MQAALRSSIIGQHRCERAPTATASYHCYCATIVISESLRRRLASNKASHPFYPFAKTTKDVEDQNRRSRRQLPIQVDDAASRRLLGVIADQVKY